MTQPKRDSGTNAVEFWEKTATVTITETLWVTLRGGGPDPGKVDWDEVAARLARRIIEEEGSLPDDVEVKYCRLKSEVAPW